MPGSLSELILGNFGKAAFYTPEEQARYGGVNLNCCERHTAWRKHRLRAWHAAGGHACERAFGGGMGIGSTCGAVVGALMVLAMKYAGAAEKVTPLKEEIVVPFLERVREGLGGLDCAFLKPRMAQEGTTVRPTVLAVARILDEAIQAREGLKGWRFVGFAGSPSPIPRPRVGWHALARARCPIL